MNKIREIENKLIIMVNNDKKNWVEFYLLMKEIEDNELWRDLGLNSFTAWVKSFCAQNKIHESIIWNRKKAGQLYLRYIEVKKSKGIEVAPLKESTLSVDTLVLLDKISNKSEKLGADLMDKAINNQIRKIDLRETYKAMRQQEANIKKEISQANSLNDENLKGVNSLYHFDKTKTSEEIANDVIISGNIITKLQKEQWLGIKKEGKKHFISTYEQDKYELFTDFKIFEPEKLSIEAVIAENLTTYEKYNVYLHGIIIKTNKNDLMQSKFTNKKYENYFDFLWLAIPYGLLEIAQLVKLENMGLIYIKNKQLEINIKGKLLHPKYKKETLTSLALKLLV